MGGLLLARGLLEFWLLDLNGRPAAAQFGFRFGNTVSQLQEGFDREYSTDSVGYVLRARAIKDLIARAYVRMTSWEGNQDTRKKWGAQVEHYLDLRFAMPFRVGAAYLQVQHYAERSKSWLRTHLHGKGGKCCTI